MPFIMSGLASVSNTFRVDSVFLVAFKYSSAAVPIRI
jgi:hypothetical protein